METLIKPDSIESQRIEIPPADMIAGMGHSIGKRPDGKWVLSGLFQETIPSNSRAGYDRTGVKIPNLDPKNSIVGGGVTNNTALAEAVLDQVAKGFPPRLVFLTGGRPPYLDAADSDQPELTEAKVMRSDLEENLAEKGLSNIKVETSESGKVTRDDIREILQAAKRNNCKTVNFFALALRIPRAEFYFTDEMEKSNEFKGIDIRFFSAEDVIKNIAVRNGKLEQFENFLNRYHASAAYRKTLEAEQAGLAREKSEANT